MLDDELQSWVESVSLKWFALPFEHQARFNNRLRTTGGRYLLRSHNLEFNPKQLAYFGSEEFVKIIKHELCHYHLHLKGRGYQHRDWEFKEWLSKVGGSRYCGLIPGTRNQQRTIYQYQCLKCGHIFKRKRKVNVRRYVCGKCKGSLRKMR